MRVKENRSSYYRWPIFRDKAWAPSEFFHESCIDSSVQINELHPPGRSSAPLPVPAPSQEFCITPNVSERQLFSSTFSSALNKSVWSASCIMKAQNHGDGTDCTGQHYQAEGVLGFAFLSGRFIYMEQNQNLPKEVSNSMLEETRNWFQMEMALFEP